MDDSISKFVTVLCIVIIIAWAWQARNKFKISVANDPFGDYEQPRTASVLGVLGTFFELQKIVNMARQVRR